MHFLPHDGVAALALIAPKAPTLPPTTAKVAALAASFALTDIRFLPMERPCIPARIRGTTPQQAAAHQRITGWAHADACSRVIRGDRVGYAGIRQFRRHS